MSVTDLDSDHNLKTPPLNPIASFFQNQHIEINSKYFLLALIAVFDIKNQSIVVINTDELSHRIGINPARIYRARNMLKRMGVLEVESKYCTKTGRKIADIYEILI